MAPLFTGVGVALVSLFDENDALDTAATRDLAVRLVDLGMRAVLVAGTTGEAMALTTAERSSLVAAVREALPADVPVLAGTGAPSGRQAAHLTRQAFEAGADAALVLSPQGVADPRAYFDTVAKSAEGRPLIAYHFPFASSPGIPLDILEELPVSGLKDSSGDAERLLEEVSGFDGDLYVGATSLLTMAGAVGVAGAIQVLANVEPEKCAAAFAGDGAAQLALAGPHRAAMSGFPAGLKRLVADRFGVSARARIGR